MQFLLGSTPMRTKRTCPTKASACGSNVLDCAVRHDDITRLEEKRHKVDMIGFSDILRGQQNAF